MTHDFHQPVFTGNASEYFRIWIVNTLLSLLTFGIWSAWATVRNRRYLYGNIEWAGNRFDFCGNAWAILRGRILAMVFFLAYAVGGDFSAVVPVATIFLLVILFPWLLTSAKRFRLSNTAWRNLRFDFPGSVRNSYIQLALPLFLILLSLTCFLVAKMRVEENQTVMESLRWNGFAALLLFFVSFFLVPVTIYRVKNLTFNTTCFGRHGFSVKIDLDRFMGIYALTILVLLTVMIVTVTFFTLVMKISGENSMLILQALQGKSFAALALLYLFLTLCYLLPYAYWNVTTTNYVLSATQLENLTIEMKMSVWVYWWYLWTNALLAVITLGIAIPWTKIRMLKYKLSCLSIRGELPVFYGNNKGRKVATGDEIGDAFNIDFGF